ncbi:MAG: putative DNA binding domain-containing protein [Alphaproteobacteria bacterium]|nr:putative DNA binding domain-containing protein [Alphaproteobacteria bacterium]
MDVEILKDLIYEIRKQKTERQNIELKSCFDGFPKKIYDTLSSFSNQDQGGIIIFGITDKPNFDICGVYDPEVVQKKIMENCNQMTPQVRALITICEIEGKFVVAAEIPSVEKALRPVYYSGVGRLKGSYLRVGDADELMSEYEIYSYEAFRKRSRDDLRIVDNSTIEKFDNDILDRYLYLIKQNKSNLMTNVSDASILDLMGITDLGKPTLAGLMVFSRFPQTFFPQFSITAVSVPGTQIGDLGENGERFIDNERIQGPIQNMIEDAVAFVKKNIKTMTIIGDDGKRHDKTEYPIVAVREAILNALVHRDYSIYTENTPISIEIYRDRMEIKSPGGLYGNFTVDALGKSRPDTRNIALASILEIMKITENRYSGIPTIYKAFKDANLPVPEFKVQRGEFIVVFRNGISLNENNIDKKDIKKAIIEFCKVPRSREELIRFTGKTRYYTMSVLIKPLIDEGIIKLTNPDKLKSKEQRFYS